MTMAEVSEYLVSIDKLGTITGRDSIKPEVIPWHSRCGYEVPEIILLYPCLYAHSLLRGVTFKVLPFSNYAPTLTMLPPFKTFLEHLLWNSFQCSRHISFSLSSISWNLRPFKADFTFWNSHKLFGIKSGEQGGWSITVINFWTTNRITDSTLWAGALSLVENPIVGKIFMTFLCIASIPWVMGKPVVCIANFIVCYRDRIKSNMSRLQWWFLTKNCCQLTKDIGSHITAPLLLSSVKRYSFCDET